MANEFDSKRLDAAILLSAQMAGMALNLEIEVLESVMARSAGPQFYIEMQAATVTFANEVRRIIRERGHERLKIAIIQLDGGGSENRG
jgi:hypothetical protein